MATGKTSAASPRMLGSDVFEGGTTALQVGNEVWFGSFKEPDCAGSFGPVAERERESEALNRRAAERAAEGGSEGW